jgi:hypothetical protein
VRLYVENSLGTTVYQCSSGASASASRIEFVTWFPTLNYFYRIEYTLPTGVSVSKGPVSGTKMNLFNSMPATIPITLTRNGYAPFVFTVYVDSGDAGA